jgi:predicted aspartyl protease
MPIAHFPSLTAADTVEVVFVKPDGSEVQMRLLVDSGFTGQSSFVLPPSAANLGHASATIAQTAGAIQGVQQRVAVVFRIPALGFETAEIAILADTSGLALPHGVHGMAGLQFLRHFRRWGSELTPTGDWRFFLETDPP